jgi:L-arabinokinase
MGIEMKQKRLAYYITPHGFGHAVRSIEVIRHLLVLAPALEIVIVSTLPEFLVHQSLGDSVPIRRRQLDIGLVQRDSIQFDLSATLERLQSLHDQRDALVADEIHFFKTQEIQTVVCDIPFLPFAAASQAFIPAIGMGNFTWDWIYQAYAAADSRWTPLVDWIRESYHKCHLLLQLPMHGDCSACPHIQDVPLVARRAQRKREETLKILGLGLDQKVYLISFGWLELGETALKRLEEITDAMFLFKHPLSFQFRNGMCLDDHPLSYEDVVAAVDGVITKPGYGIVSDCLAHGTPVIYTDRGFFPEYDILVQEMAKHLTTVYISSEDLYAGKWGAAIEELLRQPRVAPTLPCNGAEVCAEIILSYLK